MSRLFSPLARASRTMSPRFFSTTSAPVPTPSSPARSITSISCGFTGPVRSSSFFSTEAQSSQNDFSIREQEELPRSEKRHEGGLEATDPDSQISSRQPKPVKEDIKVKLMHEDFDGKANVQFY